MKKFVSELQKTTIIDNSMHTKKNTLKEKNLSKYINKPVKNKRRNNNKNKKVK